MRNGRKVIITNSESTVFAVSMRSVGSDWENKPNAVIFKSTTQTCQDLRKIYLIFLILLTVTIMMAFYLLWQKREMIQFKQKINTNYPVFVKPYEPDGNYEVARESVELSNEIGKGNFGKVFDGTLRTADGAIQNVAVKKINEGATFEESANFLNEALIMKNFVTIHIVQLLGIVSETKPYLVIMELMATKT